MSAKMLVDIADQYGSEDNCTAMVSKIITVIYTMQVKQVERSSEMMPQVYITHTYIVC